MRSILEMSETAFGRRVVLYNIRYSTAFGNFLLKVRISSTNEEHSGNE